MSEPVYVAKIKIERTNGPNRLAYLPAESEPIKFGLHGEIAEHYGYGPEVQNPNATTIDYLIAAAAG